MKSQHAEAEDVCFLCELFASGLFRGEVGERRCDRCPGRVDEPEGDPEVPQIGVALLVEEDVARLDVTVDQPAAVGITQGGANLVE